MDLLSIIIILIIVGAVLYLIQQFPLDPQIVTIIRVVVLIVVLLWLLRLFVPSLGIRLGERAEGEGYEGNLGPARVVVSL